MRASARIRKFVDGHASITPHAPNSASHCIQPTGGGAPVSLYLISDLRVCSGDLWCVCDGTLGGTSGERTRRREGYKPELGGRVWAASDGRAGRSTFSSHPRDISDRTYQVKRLIHGKDRYRCPGCFTMAFLKHFVKCELEKG